MNLLDLFICFFHVPILSIFVFCFVFILSLLLRCYVMLCSEAVASNGLTTVYVSVLLFVCLFLYACYGGGMFQLYDENSIV